MEKDEDLPGPGEYEVARPLATGPAITLVGRPRPQPVEVYDVSGVLLCNIGHYMCYAVYHSHVPRALCAAATGGSAA